jgi:hypothetical protein
VQLIQHLKIDCLYLPSQINDDLVQRLSSLKPGSCNTDEPTTGSNASVYQWPAVSEITNQDITAPCSEWIHLKSSRYFKFAKV